MMNENEFGLRIGTTIDDAWGNHAAYIIICEKCMSENVARPTFEVPNKQTTEMIWCPICDTSSTIDALRVKESALENGWEYREPQFKSCDKCGPKMPAQFKRTIDLDEKEYSLCANCFIQTLEKKINGFENARLITAAVISRLQEKIESASNILRARGLNFRSEALDVLQKGDCQMCGGTGEFYDSRLEHMNDAHGVGGGKIEDCMVTCECQGGTDGKEVG